MQAHEEAERARFFVPKNLLEIAPTRPRPLLVCISRDVSQCAKQAVNAYLCKELPGELILSLHLFINMQLRERGRSFPLLFIVNT